MKNIGIQTPCSENWNDMTPTEQGVFCQQCVKSVYDFTHQSNDEIRQTLRSLRGQSVCARITREQETLLNAEFEAWTTFRSKKAFQSAFVFSLIVVFGLTLFSCESERDQQHIKQVQATALNAIAPEPGKTEIIQQPTVPKQTEAVPAPIIAAHDLEPVAIEAVHEYPTIDMPEIEIIRAIPVEHHTVGELIVHRDYTNYLQETRPEVDENGRPYPEVFSALAYPNPATTETTLEIAIPKKDRFEIVLYDMNGKILQTIWKGKIERGRFQQTINMSDLTPGTYIVAIAARSFSETVTINKL